MRKLMLLYAALCAPALVAVTSPAGATNLKSFVASNGSDSDACTQAAPCLTFAHAIGQTSAGGEIDCLTGGDFGPVTITQSIAIDCGAGHAGGIGTNATAVNITATSGTVVLRNLDLNGFQNANSEGIVADNFNGTLVVQHCDIHGFLSEPIYFQPAGNRGLLMISDTAVYGNISGIIVEPPSGTIASVVLNRVELSGNRADGLIFLGGGTIAGTLRQSVVAENGVYGITASATGGVYFTVEESSVIDNLNAGIESFESAAVNLEVGASTIGGNGTGIAATAGSIFTFGNNQLSANGANGSFTPGGPGLQ